MARIPVFAANWKMNKTLAEAAATAKEMRAQFGSVAGAEVVVCPPATALYTAGEILKDCDIALGAQDIFWELKGAYTGLISPVMLKDAGCKYVIIGHSERRGRFGKDDPSLTAEMKAVFSDNDATVNRKALAALTNDLRPIICVGELLAEREAGKTDATIANQLEKALKDLPADRADEIVVAYEPVWAIGTGQVCEAVEANRVIAMMRQVAAKALGDKAAQQVRLLYGGSVTPENISKIMEQKEIDGVLVGGASMQAESFARIISDGFSAAKARN
jgi:triosephosphate isomerase